MENLLSFTRMAKEPSSWAGMGVAALLVGQSTDKITAITGLDRRFVRGAGNHVRSVPAGRRSTA